YDREGRYVHRSVDAEVAAKLGDVAGGLDVVEGALDAPLRIDDEGRSDDAHDRAAVVLFCPECPVCGEHGLVRVGDQRERQVLALRSEERRVGKECRTRWSTEPQKRRG